MRITKCCLVRIWCTKKQINNTFYWCKRFNIMVHLYLLRSSHRSPRSGVRIVRRNSEVDPPPPAIDVINQNNKNLLHFYLTFISDQLTPQHVFPATIFVDNKHLSCVSWCIPHYLSTKINLYRSPRYSKIQTLNFGLSFNNISYIFPSW